MLMLNDSMLLLEYRGMLDSRCWWQELLCAQLAAKGRLKLGAAQK